MRYLLKRREYLQFQKDSHRVHGQFFIVLLKERKDENDIAIGLTVSRKVGKAVCRNKVKRRLRSFLHEWSKDISIKHVWMHIIAKPGACSLLWTDFTKDLQRAIIQSLRTVTSNKYANS